MIDVMTETNDYLAEVWEQVVENIDDYAENEGELTCPTCFAEDFVENSKTMLLAEVYDFSKHEPQVAMASLHRALVIHQAMVFVTMGLMEANKEMNGDKCFIDELTNTTEETNDD